jgi:NAD(P)-dependent dehydrogenase (short-subunit alcohol dehydrogenase family)
MAARPWRLASGKAFLLAVLSFLMAQPLLAKEPERATGAARAITSLASAEASFITGTTLTADGGFPLRL